MGGKYGHMDHLYDNPNITFSVIKKVMIKAAEGELEGTEKTDGQNNFLSFDIENQEALAIRNNTHQSAGGINVVALKRFFTADREKKGKKPAPESVVNAFVDSMNDFELIASRFSEEVQRRLFLTDAGERIFYNCEVMATDNPNVVVYDTNTLLIQRKGHLKLNLDTKESSGFTREEEQTVEKYLSQFENSLNKFQDNLQKQKFSIQTNAIRKIEKLSDDTILNDALVSLDNELQRAGISDNQTVIEYLISQLDSLIDEKIDLEPVVKKELIKAILEFKSKGRILVRTIKNIVEMTPEDSKEKILSMLQNKNLLKELLSQAIWPIEKVIHFYAVELLRTLESLYILDNSKESQRLQKTLSKSINSIDKVTLSKDYPNLHASLLKQLNKLKAIEDQYEVATAAEGFVFDHDGHTYKFTGTFAPINQILGMFKYGRGSAPPLEKLASLQEQEEEENTEPQAIGREVINIVDLKSYKTIALVPGGFKPPHAGHLAMIEAFMKRADMVFIIFGSGGSRPRLINDVAVTPEVTGKVFELYLQDIGMSNYQFIKVGDKEISRTTSRKATPMSVAYDIMQLDTYTNQTVIMGASTKDATRFKGMADAYVPKDEHGLPLINLDVEPYPARSISGIGELKAGKIRHAIENNDYNTFLAHVPHASQYRAKDIWSLLGGLEDINQETEPESVNESIEKKRSTTLDLFSLVDSLLTEALDKESFQKLIDATQALDKAKSDRTAASDAINKTVATREKAKS